MLFRVYGGRIYGFMELRIYGFGLRNEMWRWRVSTHFIAKTIRNLRKTQKSFFAMQKVDVPVARLYFLYSSLKDYS